MTLEKLQGESHLDYKYRLLVDMASGELDAKWDDVNNALGLGMHKDTIRKGSIFLPEFYQHMLSKQQTTEELPAYKESTEILAGGVQKSDKLVKLSDKELKDPDYIMQIHGYDPNEWELVSSKHNMWNTNDKKRGVQTLYASKISVKPKKEFIDIDKFIAKIDKIKPVFIKQPIESTQRMLEIPFVDMHFGINSYEYYLEKLNETVEIIESKKWHTIYIPIGNDLLHNNDHKGKTANGTLIQSVDMDEAWENAFKFYSVIYEKSLENAENVVSDYVQGNHDADLSWAFVKALSKQYPQIKWDTSMEVKKHFKWEGIYLINLHGDKGLARVADTLIKEYRNNMINASTVEIHSGHLHSEKVIDKFGVLVRTLPTSAQTDDWHRDNSFEGAVKTSQIFEFDAKKLKRIYLV